MIQKGQWQEAMMRDLVALLEPQEVVQTLILTGNALTKFRSCATVSRLGATFEDGE